MTATKRPKYPRRHNVYRSPELTAAFEARARKSARRRPLGGRAGNPNSHSRILRRIIIRYADIVQRETPEIPDDEQALLRRALSDLNQEIPLVLVGILDTWLVEANPEAQSLAERVALMSYAERIALVDVAERGLALRRTGTSVRRTAPYSIHMYPEAWEAIQLRSRRASTSQIVRRMTMRYVAICQHEMPSGPWVDAAVELITTLLELPIETTAEIWGLDRLLEAIRTDRGRASSPKERTVVAKISELPVSQRVALLDAAEIRSLRE